MTEKWRDTLGNRASGDLSIHQYVKATQAQVSAAWWGLQTNVSGLASLTNISGAVRALELAVSGMVGIPAANLSGTTYLGQTVGNKGDSPIFTSGNVASMMRIVKGILQLNALATGTFTTDSPTVPADTGRTEVNDYWKGHLLMPVAGAAIFQARPIRQYTETTDVFTLDEPFTTTPGLSQYVILPGGYPVQRLLDTYNLMNSVLELNETGGTLTTDMSEQTAYISERPAAVFKPQVFRIDCTQMSGNSMTLKEYHRIQISGNYLLHSTQPTTSAVITPLTSLELQPNRHGIKVTVTAGLSGRSVDWEVFYEG